MRALLACALVLLAVPGAARAEEDEFGNSLDQPDDDRPGRLSLTAWGGQAFDVNGDGPDHPTLGGELAWSFSSLDLGVAGYGYEDLRRRESGWDPVILARITQRFQTYRGIEAGITLGIGAARRGDWDAWFQFALGLRLDLGPAFLAGELGFEQSDLLHLSAGVGFRLF